MSKEICNIEEIATYLKISQSEVRKLIREKKIPYFRIGYNIKFDLHQVNNWIDKLSEITHSKSVFY